MAKSSLELLAYRTVRRNLDKRIRAIEDMEDKTRADRLMLFKIKAQLSFIDEDMEKAYKRKIKYKVVPSQKK